MKVGFVSRIREPWGGSEELWAACARTLLPDHAVVVSAHNTGATAPRMTELLEMGARIIYRRGFIRPGLSARQRIPRKIALFAINKISNPYQSFFGEKPDVIVYTGTGDALLSDPGFLDLLYQTSTPLVYINQGHYEYIRTFDNHDMAVLEKAYSYSAYNLFVADRNRIVLERFLAAPIPNARVVRNPVNLVATDAVAWPEADRPLQIAIVGNLLINHKGQDLALEVLHQPQWSHRDWTLNLYGSGVDEDFLKKLASFYGIADRVRFHGKVTDIRKVWAQNHLCLMPSRFEGIPLAVVEAMLCARSIVATDVAGHTEWIREGQEGFIAAGANTGALAAALERAWENRAQLELLGQQARLRALELYDPEPGHTLARLVLEAVRH